MRRINQLLLILVSATLFAFTSYQQIRAINTPVTVVEPMPIIRIKVKPIKAKILEVKKDHNAFLEAIGYKESRNRYDVVNKYGYMGRYQFGKSTLKTIKIKVSREEFLNSPEIQEEAMRRLLLYNKKKLQKYIDKYNGKIVRGILVTESGILAAAHLGGAGSVKKWFRTGKVRKDGNGVKITSYMTRFGGYNLNI